LNKVDSSSTYLFFWAGETKKQKSLSITHGPLPHILQQKHIFGGFRFSVFRFDRKKGCVRVLYKTGVVNSPHPPPASAVTAVSLRAIVFTIILGFLF
jgi:hypothetical protein